MPVSVLCSNQPASDELCKVSNSYNRPYLRFGCLCVPPGLSQTVSENHPLVWIFIAKTKVFIWSSEGTKQNMSKETCQCAQKNQINLWQYECGKKEGKREGGQETVQAEITWVIWKENLKRTTQCPEFFFTHQLRLPFSARKLFVFPPLSPFFVHCCHYRSPFLFLGL